MSGLVSLALILVAIVVHEFGHLAAARVFGLRGRLGLVLRPFPYPVARILLPADPSRTLQIAVALGGPVASDLFGGVLWKLGFPLVGLTSVLLGAVSLVPVAKQDGCHIRKALAR